MEIWMNICQHCGCTQEAHDDGLAEIPTTEGQRPVLCRHFRPKGVKPEMEAAVSVMQKLPEPQLCSRR